MSCDELTVFSPHAGGAVKAPERPSLNNLRIGHRPDPSVMATCHPAGQWPTRSAAAEGVEPIGYRFLARRFKTALRELVKKAA